MTVALTPDRKEKFLTVINTVLMYDMVKIREIAGLIGLMVAYTARVDYAGAHYKTLKSTSKG